VLVRGGLKRNEPLHMLLYDRLALPPGLNIFLFSILMLYNLDERQKFRSIVKALDKELVEQNSDNTME
jgi:hypothetical protein